RRLPEVLPALAEALGQVYQLPRMQFASANKEYRKYYPARQVLEKFSKHGHIRYKSEHVENALRPMLPPTVG
ncbi:hypothetical protein L9F63_027830, partial [Diploptera punctata]